MFGVFARRVVYSVCVMLCFLSVATVASALDELRDIDPANFLRLTGNTGASEMEMTYDEFCSNYAYVVYPGKEREKKGRVRDLGGDIYSYTGAKIVLLSHFWPKEEGDGWLEGIIGPAGRCEFDEDKYATDWYNPVTVQIKKEGFASDYFGQFTREIKGASTPNRSGNQFYIEGYIRPKRRRSDGNYIDVDILKPYFRTSESQLDIYKKLRASKKMDAETFCKEYSYYVERSPDASGQPALTEYGYLSELNSNIHRYDGATIELIGHFYPTKPVTDTEFFFEGQVGGSDKCKFYQDVSWSSGSVDTMVPAMVFSENFPPIPQGYEMMKKMVIRNTHKTASRNVFGIVGRINLDGWLDKPYIHVLNILPLNAWQPKELQQNAVSRQKLFLKSIRAERIMSYYLFCDVGLYYVKREGDEPLEDSGGLNELAKNLDRYEGAEIDLTGHFYPWNPVKNQGDWFDGQVGPIGTCIYNDTLTYSLGSKKMHKMVPVEFYKEDFPPLRYERFKKMVIRNTDQIASRNIFDIKGTIKRNKEGVLYLRVKDIKTTNNWKPRPNKKLTREEFKQFLKLSPEQQQNLLMRR